MSASNWIFRLTVRLLAASVLYAVAASAQPIRPNIIINNDTGVAEGSGSGAPGTLAPVVAPIGCSTVGSSTTVTATGHGMGGFPVDGSSALWINTPSGLRWTRVTAFPDGNTITVSPAVNSGGGLVACAMGGKLAGPLATLNISTTRGLCASVASGGVSLGFTITIENTGIDYVETNTVGCPLNDSGNTTANGRLVIQGDDPDNPTHILVQYNGNYIFNNEANVTSKVQYLHITKDAVGTTGVAIQAGNNGSIIKGVIVDQSTGSWAQAYNDGGRPALILSSQFYGPFATNCRSLDDDDLVINNYFEGCSGTTSAFQSPLGIIIFNIIDNEGANQAVFSSATNSGSGGWRAFNTIISSGGSGVVAGANFSSLYTGNLISSSAELAGGCFVAGTNSLNLLGDNGTPSLFWGGNASDECVTARYTGGLLTSPQGAPNDVLAGGQFTPNFVNVPALDFLPTNTDAKTDLAFPGASFPFQTPAAPVSTMTVGAAQLFGAGGSSAYAF